MRSALAVERRVQLGTFGAIVALALFRPPWGRRDRRRAVTDGGSVLGTDIAGENVSLSHPGPPSANYSLPNGRCLTGGCVDRAASGRPTVSTDQPEPAATRRLRAGIRRMRQTGTRSGGPATQHVGRPRFRRLGAGGGAGLHVADEHRHFPHRHVKSWRQRHRRRRACQRRACQRRACQRCTRRSRLRPWSPLRVWWRGRSSRVGRRPAKRDAGDDGAACSVAGCSVAAFAGQAVERLCGRADAPLLVGTVQRLLPGRQSSHLTAQLVIALQARGQDRARFDRR